jgi:hypothetical protein
MDFEVTPGALRRGGGDLLATAGEIRGEVTAAYHAVAPPAGLNSGWTATATCDAVAAAAESAVARLAAWCRDLGEALRAAADAYQSADEQAARRLRW